MWFEALVILSAVAGGAIAGVTGFGIGSVLTPALAWQVDTRLAVAAVSVPHLIGTAFRFWLLGGRVNQGVLWSFGLMSAGGGLAAALMVDGALVPANRRHHSGDPRRDDGGARNTESMRQRDEPMNNLPIVCTLTPETFATRKAQLLPGLFRRAAATDVTSNGYRLHFDSSAATLHAIATAIEAERHCCRFLRFNLAVEPDEGPLVLTLSGPPGAREFVAALCDV